MNVRDRLAEIVGSSATARQDTDAILAEFVVIHRDELPAVNEGPHEGYAKTVGSGGTFESAFYESSPTAPASDPEWHRNHARHHLALAEYLQTLQPQRLNKRRDEWAREAFPGRSYDAPQQTTYASLSPGSQKLIDYIIELEDRAS